MKVVVLNEAGYDEAMLGLSLSYNQPVENMPTVANKLAHKDDGHNKFLESIVVWLDITAPRYWGQQFDTYRIGVTKQSESTMHTLRQHRLTQDNFAHTVPDQWLNWINSALDNASLSYIKGLLPEGFLQRRIVCTNYKALRHIIKQRKNHRLSEWQFFISEIRQQVRYPHWLPY